MSKTSFCEYGRVHVVRAAKMSGALAVLLLAAGCSSGVERLSSFNFDSGYTQAKVAGAPAHTASTANIDQASALPKAEPSAARWQLAQNETPNAGYLQAARVELDPIREPRAPRGVQTADGYGAYNRGPLRDGVYEGPRVSSPYDGPRGNGKIVVPPDEDLIIDHGPGAPRNGRPYNGDVLKNGYEPEGGPRRRRDFGPGYGGEYEPPRNGRAYGNAHPGKGGGKVVKVERGDTLYAIAIRYGTTVPALIDANGLPDTHIRTGQELLIPNGGPVAYASRVENVDRPSRASVPRCVDQGSCHVVTAGESIGSIAQRHGVAAIEILDANGLSDPRQIKPGHVLVIPEANGAPLREGSAGKPGSERTRYAARSDAPASRSAGEGRHASSAPAQTDDVTAAASNPSPEAADGRADQGAGPQVAAISPGAPAPTPENASCEAALANPLPRTGQTFRQPVEGLVITKFGPKPDGGISDGINISVPKGTPIKAAENGVVAYVGNELSGYGNLILIRHADDYVTAYGHADEVMVRRCDVVKRGQVIAKAGATGDVSQPQLHFEVRKASKPVDPTTLF
jgi:murein DD-endopeptidase MepM/ murein hydrolase activator NlpD